jgi:hypothetical protein
MRFRAHLVSSALLGLALYPREPLKLLAVTLAGTLIDVDHLLLYALQTGDWSVTGALRYDRYRHRGQGVGDTRPRYGSLRSWLHEPWLLLPPLWVWAARHPALLPVAAGLSLHLLMDQYDAPLRLLARARTGGRCRLCGRRAPLSIHRFGQRGERRYIALCRACTEEMARLRQLPLTPPRQVTS